MYDVVNAPASWLGEHVPFIGHLLGTAGFTYLGDWYFDEFSIVFLIGSVIVAVINKMSQDEFVSEFVRGASELISLTFVISVSHLYTGSEMLWLIFQHGDLLSEQSLCLLLQHFSFRVQVEWQV